jgi:hypothetical protein
MTTRWPWISMLISLVLTLSPLGRDLVQSAFFASEGLSRGIWGPIALVIIAIMASVILAEWLIRTLILHRRARGATTV